MAAFALLLPMQELKYFQSMYEKSENSDFGLTIQVCVGISLVQLISDMIWVHGHNFKSVSYKYVEY